MANFILTYTALATDASVGIEVFKPSALVAPAQIWLRAVDHDGLAAFEETGSVYDGAFHEYYHEWTINGEPLNAFNRVANVVGEHNNPNKMFGREVGFVLPVAGDYVIDLVVTDRNGDIATASTNTLTVHAPETYFPEADRIYVDITGVYDGVPAASGKVRTLEDLRLAMNSRNANPTWVLFKRGQGHSLDGVNPAGNYNGRGSLTFDSNNKVQLVSAYGTGAAPVITQSMDATRQYTSPGFGIKNPLNDNWRTFSGIRFEGEYDPETERGAYTHSYPIVAGSWVTDNGFLLFHDLNTEGTAYGLGTIGPTDTSLGNNFRHMIADCLIDGYKDYGIFGGSRKQRLAILGVGVVQKPEAMNKGDQSGFRNSHGPIRIPYGTLVLVSMCDILTRGAHDGNDQPCLRLFPSSDTGQNGYVDRCTMEGGFEVIHLRRSSQQDGAVPYNVVVERNLLVSSTYTQHHIHAQRSGVTIRDNLLIDANVERIVSSGLAAINFSADDNVPLSANAADPIAIHSNTYVNLMSAANDGSNRPFDLVVNEGDYYTNVVVENNVAHKPDGDVTFTDFAPIDTETAIGGVGARYGGLRFGFVPIEITLASDCADGAVLSVPYASFDQTLSDGTVLGGATDQAYWQALEADNTRHQVRWLTTNGRRARFYAEWDNIDVDFTNASHVQIRNQTGETWLSGDTLGIWLDRTTLLQPIDATYANPPTIPLPRPYGNSEAIGKATNGRVSPRDFLLTDRGTAPSKGALEPAP